MANSNDTGREPMSEARLAEIRARVEAATPGPWHIAYGPNNKRWVQDSDDLIVCTVIYHRNALFIAHAPEDICDLLADNERLRAREAALLVHQRATQEDIIEGRAREAALVAVVERVAEAGVGDDSSGGTWLMFSGYDAETVREQARALLAASPEPPDATTAE